MCKIGSDNDTITGPVDRLYLWKEWNTRTTVDDSSTQTLTLPSLPSTTSFVDNPLSNGHDDKFDLVVNAISPSSSWRDVSPRVEEGRV